MNQNRYQLRFAGGQYWLLDMEQPGVPYKQPAVLDEMGADLWHRVWELGQTIPEAAGALSAEYGVPQQQIAQDMDAFFRQLAEKGYPINKTAG